MLSKVVTLDFGANYKQAKVLKSEDKHLKLHSSLGNKKMLQFKLRE